MRIQPQPSARARPHWVTRGKTSRQGFTLVELMIVVLLIGIITTMGFPALQKFYGRTKLLGAVQEIQTAMRQARYEALKTQQPTIFRIDPTSVPTDPDFGLMESWVDSDDDGIWDQGTEKLIMRTKLAAGIYVIAPAGDSVKVVGFGTDDQVHFQADGSVQETGAYRIADRDAAAAARNFLEVRVRPRSVARVEVNKWYEADSAWYGRDSAPTPWVWY